MKKDMPFKVKRKELNNRFFNVFENNRLAFGFTERGFSLKDLGEYFNKLPVIQLKQIHSSIILYSDQIKPGASGDGIILNHRDHLGLIKTADCIPLSFWNENYQMGGIVHIGWRGLYQRIETGLLQILSNTQTKKENLWFHIGPAIEQNCYPVGPEIHELFNNHSFRDQVFSSNGEGQLYLDLKKALTLSLFDSGVAPQRIIDSRICNFCEQNRFPSFRRDGQSKKRIYNFLLLK